MAVLLEYDILGLAYLVVPWSMHDIYLTSPAKDLVLCLQDYSSHLDH